jgi:hypothetical protein
MANVPLSMQQLEDIATFVSRELLENWAINDRFPEDKMSEAAVNAVDDTIFIINKFMEQFNYYMLLQENPSQIIKPE